MKRAKQKEVEASVEKAEARRNTIRRILAKVHVSNKTSEQARRRALRLEEAIKILKTQK